MKLPFSPCGFEPWACFLIDPRGSLHKHRRKPPKALLSLAFSGTVGPTATVRLERLL